MADPEPSSTLQDGDNDVDMSGVEAAVAGAEEELDAVLPAANEEVKQMSFLDYLKSPIVDIVVGTGDAVTTLSAHQAFIIRSPYFADACSKFAPDAKQRRIELPHEDLDAVGSVLEYLYNSEYFPKRLDPSAKDSALEADATVAVPDESGAGLLRHARVYTLADKLRLPALKSLAHSKIHNTASTAKGEIAYARYVYAETARDDAQIRRPVAAFWATRSHKLRHQAEDEFRAMCLEFPQFGFDVLSLVLDQKEKGKAGLRDDAAAENSGRGQATPHTGRKRARHNSNV